MTIQEIKTYLKKHYFLIFRYKSKYYSLKRDQILLKPIYSLITTDMICQQRSSLEELCERVYIHKGTLLIEAIEHIEIPEFNDPSWESYEAVRHSAIVYGTEIHFLYREKWYWIAPTVDGLSHLSDDFGNTQIFNSCRDLFEDARIDGSALEEIWEKVVVDAC